MGRRLGAQAEAIAHVLLDKAVAVVAANDRVGQLHVLDHGLQLAPVAGGDFAAEDRRALVGLAERAVGIEQTRTQLVEGRPPRKDEVVAILHLREEEPVLAAGLPAFVLGEKRGWQCHRTRPTRPPRRPACNAVVNTYREIELHAWLDAGDSQFASYKLADAENSYRAAAKLTDPTTEPEAWLAAHGKLANGLERQKNYEEALDLRERIAALVERRSGSQSPEFATALNHTAFCLAKLALYPQAEALYRRALAIDEESYGPEHPKVATRLKNLADLLDAANRPGEAEPIFRAHWPLMKRPMVRTARKRGARGKDSVIVST